MEGKRFFLVCALVLALAYWMFDSAAHYFVYGEARFEFLPTNSNELWMRSAIFVLLVAFGIFADYHGQRMATQENEKNAVCKSALDATNNILGNALQSMQLLYSEAEKNGDCSKEMLRRFAAMIDDMIRQINDVNAIKRSDKETIEQKHKPI